MSKFDIDQWKVSWQHQDFKKKYNQNEILEMLNQKSKNGVKYIFWISVFEFIFFFALSVVYLFLNESNNSLYIMMEKLGININYDVEKDFAHLNFLLKIISLCITAVFVILFYWNYKKIKIEDTLKKLIIRILHFRKTVNVFIFTNIFLLITYTLVISKFILKILHDQNIELKNSIIFGLVSGILLVTVLGTFIIWLYYRIVYGIIMKKLSKNLAQLQSIESEAHLEDY